MRLASRRTTDLIGALLMAVVVGVGIAFLVIPLLVTALMAFDARNYLGPLPPPALSLHWFTKLLGQEEALSSLGISLLLASLAVLINTLAGTAAALALSRGAFIGRESLKAAFLSPLIVPPVVIGFGLLLFLAKISIVNGFTRLLVGHLVITLPYAIRTSLASLEGFDSRLGEAALILGATERLALFDITLPLIRTGIITGAIFTFAVSMDDVSVSLFLSDAATTTFPVTLVTSMRASFDLTIAAAAIVLMAVTFVLILILERLVGFDRVLGQGLFRS